jgi:hypothetical protein
MTVREADMVLGLDPGLTVGYARISTEAWPPRIVQAGEDDEAGALLAARNTIAALVAVEGVEARGMAVGQDTMDTAYLSGRLVGHAEATGHRAVRVLRRKVKLELCGSSRAKDANVRQAIIDLYPPTGGGKCPQIGTKKNPGPLYGVAGHAWPALAVAIVAALDERTVAARRIA